MKTQNTTEKVIQPLKAYEITVDEGEAAWKQLSCGTFLASWDKLYQQCPWATIFQHRSFVATWYQVYRSRYRPLIIRAEYGGRLTGLLTLAVPASGSKGRIIGAGHFEAEYHTWLTEPTDNGRFIQSALSKVQQLFPRFAIQLRFIPPHTPLQWLDAPYWKKRCVLQTAKRPIMDLQDPSVEKFFRKDELKLKLNRLKKMGPLVLERITDKTHFAAILDELTTLYDFRQGAMFNKNQFRGDPQKADFIMALFEQNLLHVTVLTVNGNIFASISAVIDQEWVYFSGGINIHAPFHAKRTSPGFVSFMLLAQQLLNEGVAVIDLTPGGDAYKERMATRHELVHELMVTNDRFYRIKRRLRKKIHAYLTKSGKRPMGTELAWRKKLYLLKGRLRLAMKQGVLKTAFAKIKQLVQPPTSRVYTAAACRIAVTERMPINKNTLTDLLCFEESGSWKTRWEFLEDAMHHFEIGESAYTYCEDGRLLYCIWLAPTTHATNTYKKQTDKNIPESPLRFENFYCHPKGQDRQNAFLSTVISLEAAPQSTTNVQLVSAMNNKKLYKELKAMGFVEEGKGIS